MVDLLGPVQYIKGVGPHRADLLARMGVRCLWDLLHLLPRRYEDRRHLRRIASLLPGETETVLGRVEQIRTWQSRKGRLVTEALIEDGSGRMDAIWFNQPYIERLLPRGKEVILYGEVVVRDRLSMVAPEFEVMGDDDGETVHTRRITPVYPLTEGLSQKGLRRILWNVIQGGKHLAPEYLPNEILDRYRLPELAEAYRSIHFPESQEELERARQRFMFDEYLHFATALHRRRESVQGRPGVPFRFTPDLDRKIRSLFGFALTPDQDRVIEEIVSDLRGEKPMYRLLQGDVGSGKTVVALYAMLVAVRNGCQGAMMVPTEVLAEQHFQTIRHYLRDHPVSTLLLTRGTKDKKGGLEAIAKGEAHIVVGTHAMIQDPVQFARLGLVVIDEQHRFGVAQRAELGAKGPFPHILVMTATPIPRSLCLTAFGDLDLSVIEASPPGRQPVRTVFLPPERRAQAVDLVRREVKAGRQAYLVYPVIEPSEKVALAAAVEAYEALRAGELRDLRVALLHGRMPSEQKEEVARRFQEGDTDVLVSTAVIEVGIDVPNATVMVIQDAHRFGLAQLHQLRGRVGRGPHPSYCVVSGKPESEEGYERLRIFCETTDGFRIAEEDLRMRGPGDFFGTRQSGHPIFRIGNPLTDTVRFQVVGRELRKLLSGEVPFRDRDAFEAAFRVRFPAGPPGALGGWAEEPWVAEA